jgi:hypothetical protein
MESAMATVQRIEDKPKKMPAALRVNERLEGVKRTCTHRISDVIL